VCQYSWNAQHDCSPHHSFIQKRKSAASSRNSMAAHARTSTKHITTTSRIVDFWLRAQRQPGVSPRLTAFRTPTGSPQRGPLYVRLVRRTGQCFRESARRGAQSFRSLAPRGGSNFLRTETSFTSSSLCERLPADANPAHRHRRDILERSVVASCCVKECEPGHFQASFTAASRCGRVNGGPGGG
jgi:hypothetical protein